MRPSPQGAERKPTLEAKPFRRGRAAAAVALALAVCATWAAVAFAGPGAEPTAVSSGREQLTFALTDGNGHSRNAVISQDRRYAQVIAFESEASDLVGGDTNGLTDVFFIRRRGGDNRGTPWQPGPVQLASRGMGGQPANGPSFAPAIDGGFKRRGGEPTLPRCLAFLSEASNLVPNDTNGQVDAFVSHGPGQRVERVSLEGTNTELNGETTHVTVSTDCSHFAFVTDGVLHLRENGRSVEVPTAAPVSDPSFSSALSDELVFSAGRAVFLMAQGLRRGERSGPLGTPTRVAAGLNPAFNDVKCRVVAYEKQVGRQTQIGWRFLGEGEDAGTGATCRDLPGRTGGHERIASRRGANGGVGNLSSRHPTVVNAGFYIGFESDASNLQTKAGDPDKPGVYLDENRVTDAFLWSGSPARAEPLTLIMSSNGSPKGVPYRGGGGRPSVSWYANYVVFHSPGNTPGGINQIRMRYLGGL